VLLHPNIELTRYAAVHRADWSAPAAAQKIGASTFIERLFEGYDTSLAERRSDLSTWQKQLIALARVAVFNPEIVLVMDEGPPRSIRRPRR
jgi:ABC-type bacteriocin/lantibiotic exporter with double-glycine peptidase domain